MQKWPSPQKLPTFTPPPGSQGWPHLGLSSLRVLGHLIFPNWYCRRLSYPGPWPYSRHGRHWPRGATAPGTAWPRPPCGSSGRVCSGRRRSKRRPWGAPGTPHPAQRNLSKTPRGWGGGGAPRNVNFSVLPRLSRGIFQPARAEPSRTFEKLIPPGRGSLEKLAPFFALKSHSKKKKERKKSPPTPPPPPPPS